jgi:hypothetical protein
LIRLVVLGQLVGMYLRTTQRKNRDGSVVRYVQLAHNRRVDGVTQAQVLLNLGREDRLDRDGLRRLVACWAPGFLTLWPRDRVGLGVITERYRRLTSGRVTLRMSQS